MLPKSDEASYSGLVAAFWSFPGSYINHSNPTLCVFKNAAAFKFAINRYL